MELHNISASDPDSSKRYEKLYSMVLDAIPSSVLLIDRDMRIVSANRNFLEKSQRTMRDTIGQRLDEVFPHILLSDMNITRRIYEVFEKKQPTRGERMIYRSPGISTRIYYYRIIPFSWEGIVQNAMLLMEDVTDQVRLSEEVRRVERHLASVVESASDIVLSTDTEGRILSWNPAAERLSGHTFQEVKKNLFFKYCAERYHEEVKEVFDKMKMGHKPQLAEWDLVSKNGGIVEASWVLSPMRDDFFRTVGIVALGRDLTERRKFEMQLLQSQKLAALGVMAGGIAHEIRNPLAICSSGAQFLLDGDMTPDFCKECAEKILAGIHRASHIIENLLGFARVSTITEMVELDLIGILRETITLIENQARIQKIKLSAHFPVTAALIIGNASLLQQVFMNLFLNAINAMPDGGALTISVEKAGSEVLARVSDTGHGISKADIHNVFDPFYRQPHAGKGTGLGLSICYSIVKHHFGSIEVDSVEGKGATFTVRLPTVQIESDK